MFDFKLATRLIATKRIEKPNIYVRFWRFWSVWISESAWKLPELVAQADSLRLEFLHFIGSRMFRGAGFQAGYARFHAGIFCSTGILACVGRAVARPGPDFIGSKTGGTACPAQADSLRLEFPQAVSLKGETGHLSGFFELSS